MRLPKSVEAVIAEFEKLPGIGPKTAQRLTYFLLHAPKERSVVLASAIAEHYLPKFAGDILPATSAGKILAIADKIDYVDEVISFSDKNLFVAEELKKLLPGDMGVFFFEERENFHGLLSIPMRPVPLQAEHFCVMPKVLKMVRVYSSCS